MIVNDLDIGGAFIPSKTDAPLDVNANAVLPPPFALQSLQTMTRRRFKVAQPLGGRQHFELSSCHTLYSLEPFDRPVERQMSRITTFEAADHCQKSISKNSMGQERDVIAGLWDAAFW